MGHSGKVKTELIGLLFVSEAAMATEKQACFMNDLKLKDYAMTGQI